MYIYVYICVCVCVCVYVCATSVFDGQSVAGASYRHVQSTFFIDQHLGMRLCVFICRVGMCERVVILLDVRVRLVFGVVGHSRFVPLR